MKNNLVFYLFILFVVVVSCGKKQEKPLDVEIDVNTYLEPDLDKDKRALEEKLYERNFSEISVDDFVREIKEKNYTSFHYYINGKIVNKSSKLSKINNEFLEMINNGQFIASLRLENINEIRESKGKVDRKMQIKLKRYKAKEDEIEPYFIKLKKLLDQLAKK